MSILISGIQIFAAVISCLAALLSVPLFFAFRWPAAAMWGLKVYVSALSPVLVLAGIITGVIGLLAGSIFISLLGVYIILIYAFHIISITRAPKTSGGFEQAFGSDWEDSISSIQKTYYLPKRLTLRLPSVPTPHLEQNIPFATIPGTDRKLLCDVWRPPDDVIRTGVAYIYLHGSAFWFLDKDYGTRPFFTHLAAQGHVVMDVAYRLAPETDIQGMVHDVKRAIFWMKEHEDFYNIDPTRIIVSGGSAGAHLALMAAYTCGEEFFTPAELKGKDLRVCGVISLYGPADLTGLYYHTKQHRTTKEVSDEPKKPVRGKSSKWVLKSVGEDYHRLGFDKGFENIGSLAPILGGHPDECPERYAFYSPILHVHKNCPPTLLIHGAHDIMAPVADTYRLNRSLMEAAVPTVMHILPQTDHGFDLILPKISLSAHNAIYDVEHFMAVTGVRKRTSEKNRSPQTHIYTTSPKNH